MSKRRTLDIVLYGIRQLRDPYYQGFAAQLAFYFLLSVVPLLILLSQILGVFSISLGVLEEMIVKYVASDVVESLLQAVKYAPSGAINVVFVVLVLWAASRAQFSMMRLANYTISGGRTTGHGFFKDRIRAVFMTVFTLFTMSFALVILVYGEVILNVVVSVLAQQDMSYHVDKFWFILRWPITLALYFFMVSSNYYILPSTRVPFKKILPGSIFASAGMLLITWGFNLYASNVARYDILYGSLASIVAVMVWFYLIAWVIGLGIVLNKAWMETKNPE